MTTVCDPNGVAITNDQACQPLDLPDGVPPLRSFYLYMSNSCNLACRHCWITPRYVDGQPDPGDVIELDALHKAVREAKPLGLASAKLTGGEPMLHPRFIEIVDMLTDEGLELNMETNGTLITAANARYLKEETNVHFISVSIDGATPGSHDSFRRVPGAFEAVLRGLDYLVAAGYDNVQVIMCPHRGNIYEIDDVVNLAVEHGAGSVKFNPVIASGRGTAMHERGEALGFDDILVLVRYVRGELQDRTSIPVMTLTPPAMTTMRELWRNEDRPGDCGVRNILGFLGTGEIVLCGIGRTIPELVYGRLGEENIRDIWLTHPAILQLRYQLDDYQNFPGICGECVHAKQCLTNCVANNYVNSGHLIWPAPLCEEAERQGVFPASRRRTKALV